MAQSIFLERLPDEEVTAGSGIFLEPLPTEIVEPAEQPVTPQRSPSDITLRLSPDAPSLGVVPSPQEQIGVQPEFLGPQPLPKEEPGIFQDITDRARDLKATLKDRVRDILPTVSGADPVIVEKTDLAAQSNQVPTELFRRLVKRESDFNPAARGLLDEIGLTQIRPGTFKDVSPQGDILDIDQNLQAGASFLKTQHNEAIKNGYTGIEAWKFAASAYNGGPANLKKAIRKAKRRTGKELPSFKDVSRHLDKRAVRYANDVTNVSTPEAIEREEPLLGLTLEEQREREFGVIRQDKATTIKEDIQDTFRAVGKGFADTFAVYGFLLDKIGNPIGKYVQDLGQRDAASLKESFNKENLQALGEEVFTSTGPGTFDLEINSSGVSPRSIYFKLLNSLPGMAAGFGTGAVLNKTLLQFAQKLGINVGTKTTAVVGATSFGFGEGVIEGGFTSMQVAETILQADVQTLSRSPLYQSYLAQGLSPEEAKIQLADTLSSKAGFESGLISAALGAPMGTFFGRLLGRAGGRTRIANIVIGAGGETLQEAAQGFFSGKAGAEALQEAGFEGLDPTKIGLQEAAAGAVVAPFAGGGITALIDPGVRPPTTQPKIFAEQLPGEAFPAEEAPPIITPEPEVAVEPEEPPAEIPPTPPGRLSEKEFRDRMQEFIKGELKRLEQEEVSPDLPPAPDPTPEQEVEQNEAADETQIVNIPGTTGNQVNLKTPTNGPDVVYRVVEKDDLIVSHNPVTFEPNPDYPAGLQERQYHTDKNAQLRIIDQTEKFDPAFIVNTTPTAIDGPPIITSSGVVLGGNSRAMTIARVYDEGDPSNFIAKINENAESFGLPSTEGFRQPVIVRQVIDPPDNAQELRALASDLNRPFTAELGQFEKAVSAGQRVSTETLDFIGNELALIGEKATLRQLLTQRAPQIANRFLQDKIITQRELPGLFDTKRNLFTDKGKDFVENTLLGTLVDDPVLLSNIPPSTKNKLIAVLPSTSIIKTLGPEFDISQDIEDALDAVIKAKAANQTAEDFFSQSTLFGEGGLSDRATALFESLMNDSPNKLKNKFRSLASAAAQESGEQASFLPTRSLDEIFTDVFKEDIKTVQGFKRVPGREARPTAKRKPTPREKPKAQPKSVIPDPLKEPALPDGNKDNQSENDHIRYDDMEVKVFEKTKAIDVQLPTEPTTKATITKTKIIDMVENVFGVPVRNRVTRAMGDAAGWFEEHGKLIRIKAGRWSSVEILTHELAHNIDSEIAKKNGKNWKTKFLPQDIRKQAIKELKNLDYDQKKQRISEGFPEFVRHYLTTGKAKELAPTYYNWFTEEFLKRATINDKGDMALRPRVTSLLPFADAFGKPLSGFRPFAPEFSRLKKDIEIWYAQGSVNRMRAQIDFKNELPDSEETLRRKAYKFTMTEFYDVNFIFEEVTEKIKQVTRKDIPPDKDPFQLATFYKGKVAAISETMIRKAMVDPFGRIVGPSLTEAIKPAKLKNNRDMEDWLTYAVALRAKNNARRGFETGFDPVDINHVIDKFDKKPGWKEAAENVTEWSNQLMDWYVWSGDLSAELKQLFRDLNPIYLPFMRVFRESLNISKVAGGFEQISQAVKTTRGSARPIKNPMDAFIESTSAIVSRAIKTKIASTLADLASEPGVGGFITEIPGALHVKKFQAGKIIDQLEEMGADLSNIDPEEILNLWYRDSNFYGKENVVAIWRDGKLKLFEVHKDLYLAMKETDSVLMPGVRVLAPFARLMRLGATGLNFAFSNFTNPVRDFVWSAVMSERKFQTPLNPIAGLLQEFTAKPNSVTDRALNAGLQMATMMGLDRGATTAMYDDVVNGQLGLKGKVLHVVKHPVDALRRLFQIFEIAPRITAMGRYDQIQKENPGWSPDAVFIKAFNEAQDITVNFTKSGRTGRQINEVSAFFNVTLQGPNKLFRALKENPVRTIWRSLIWVTLPALLLWDKNKDKEWYKNIPPEYKYLNMWYEDDDGNVVRIPGTHELYVLFGGLIAAGLDKEHSRDGGAMAGAIKALISTLNPLNAVIPSVGRPFLDVGFNSNWLGQPIEPEWMRDEKTGLPIEDRKFFFTPGLSVEMSKGLRALGFKLSPIQTDAILRQLTGGLYQRGHGLMNTTPNPADAHPINPITYLRFPSRPSRQLNKFFTDKTNLQQAKNVGKLPAKDVLKLQRMNLFFRTQMKPLQARIRKQQKIKTAISMREIDRLYGLLAKRMNRFFDPKGRGEAPFQKK